MSARPVVVVGLFDSVEGAAAAARALHALPLPEANVTTISSVALPDGAVVKERGKVRFPWVVAVFWFVGAFAAFGLTLTTYLVYPMITAGKPITTVPPTIIVTYEGAMLGALLATIVGAFRSIGLGWFRPKKVFDPRIHDGKIALCAAVEAGEQERLAVEAMRSSGGTDVRPEEGTL
ncbi:MAG: quinol:electron acceptor oxidoreductase subunit ActD [Gemmatimonadota bacterium]